MSSESSSWSLVIKGRYRWNCYHLIYTTNLKETTVYCNPVKPTPEVRLLFHFAVKKSQLKVIYVFLNGKALTVHSPSLSRRGQQKEQELWKAAGPRFRYWAGTFQLKFCSWQNEGKPLFSSCTHGCLPLSRAHSVKQTLTQLQRGGF